MLGKSQELCSGPIATMGPSRAGKWLWGESIDQYIKRGTRLLVMAEEETAIMDICFDEAITVAEYSKTPDSKQKQAYLDQLKKTFLSLEGRGGELNTSSNMCHRMDTQ